MSDWAKPKVVCICIDDDFSMDIPQCPATRFPMLGEILTIASVIASDAKEIGDVRCPAGIFASFDEVPFDQGSWHGIRWPVDHFKPLITATESEDLAVFRRIADLAGVDEALRRLEGVE